MNHDLPSSNCDLPVGPPGGGGGGGRAKILARPAAAEACFNTLSSCPRPPGWPAQAKNDCKDYAIFRHILQVVGTVSLQVPAQHMFSCYLADATWHMVQHHFVLFRAAIIDGHFLCLCASRCNAWHKPCPLAMFKGWILQPDVFSKKLTILRPNPTWNCWNCRYEAMYRQNRRAEDCGENG